MDFGKGNIEISINQFESRCFLNIGKETIEIKDYKITSTAHENTELVIQIVCNGRNVRFETSATQEALTQQNL